MEHDLSKEAVVFMRKEKAELVQLFSDKFLYPSLKNPASVFMAGSPGAGKTEFSKRLIKRLNGGVVRIDPDEIRNKLPDTIYDGSNAHLFQNAIKIGVDAVFYSALKNGQNFILDGTMQNLDRARSNLIDCYKYRKTAQIFYLYQDPYIAWRFTIDREKEEGRRISKETFINSFFESRKNVNLLKEEFGNKLILNFVEKDFVKEIEKIEFGVENVDNHIKNQYTREVLEKELL